jgi:hypothetical protein
MKPTQRCRGASESCRRWARARLPLARTAAKAVKTRVLPIGTHRSHVREVDDDANGLHEHRLPDRLNAKAALPRTRTDLARVVGTGHHLHGTARQIDVMGNEVFTAQRCVSGSLALLQFALPTLQRVTALLNDQRVVALADGRLGPLKLPGGARQGEQAVKLCELGSGRGDCLPRSVDEPRSACGRRPASICAMTMLLSSRTIRISLSAM